MIIGTLALMSMLFFGSSTGLLPLDHLRSDVNQYVEEKDRRKDILKVVDNFEIDLAKNYKERNRRIVKLIDLYSDYSTKEDEMSTIIDSINFHSKEYLDTLMINWIQLKSLLSHQEWEEIISVDDKSVQKILDQRIELGKKIQEQNEEVKETIYNLLSTKNAKQVDKLYSSFYYSFREYFNHIYHQQESDIELFTNKNSDQQDFEEKFIKFYNMQTETFDKMSEFHFKTKEMITKKNWEKIILASKNVIVIN